MTAITQRTSKPIREPTRFWAAAGKPTPLATCDIRHATCDMQHSAVGGVNSTKAMGDAVCWQAAEHPPPPPHPAFTWPRKPGWRGERAARRASSTLGQGTGPDAKGESSCTRYPYLRAILRFPSCPMRMPAPATCISILGAPSCRGAGSLVAGVGVGV
ncbi:hypothetical protein KVR01_003625 [Diaporthe batatas]|uniref:uncharacterized protein n=1 Tax=Diaporthe batatas TaxID=748121 RepID=UPI001D049263|nr:uncharacterized protein KVR01_003625 [Diaporthe batatas]KAG8167936.1 hypothetical protein KVR01_003625 [Diaporthe batatas]